MLFWAHPSPPLSSAICYLLVRFKSPILYLIKSKFSDQDTRCSIREKFLHFLTYKKYFFFQGQISNLITARPMANTLWRTHCCRHKCFPVCPRAQHLFRTQILCPGQKHFVSATNVSQFAQSKKHRGQQCVRNNVSSFARAFTLSSAFSLSPISGGSSKRT